MTTETILDAVWRAGEGRDRVMVAVAGPPGAGKSTFAGELARRLPRGSAKAVPMDGFHYDNAVLDELGLRARKGAPETFDYAGFAALLERIRSVEPGTAIPLFDREADLARAGGDLIRPEVKFIIVEGNYLLLDEAPWTGLTGYFDLTVFLDVSREELRRRLMRRWLDLGDSEQHALHWVTTNDLPNIDRVLSHQRAADFRLSTDR